MKTVAFSIPVSLSFLGLVAVTCAAPTTTGFAVCSRPSVSCNRSYKTFEPYELGLFLPKSIKPNVAYSSISFYAVVLKQMPAGAEPNCDRGEFSSSWENERVRVQKLFPQRKVFADHQCPDMGTVRYTMNGQPCTHAFIAIYGGANSKEAQTVLAKIKAKYKTAKIKPMQVAFEQIMQ